jgi:hypothetical protein
VVKLGNGVDRLGTCRIEYYMENPTFTRACLSDVGVINVIMRVPLVESLCQAAVGWIAALEHLLPGMHGACGHVLTCRTINVIPRTPVLGKYLSNSRSSQLE